VTRELPICFTLHQMESAPTTSLQLPHYGVLLSFVGFLEHPRCEIRDKLRIGSESQ
jgi:hypothetical protein